MKSSFSIMIIIVIIIVKEAGAFFTEKQFTENQIPKFIEMNSEFVNPKSEFLTRE